MLLPPLKASEAALDFSAARLALYRGHRAATAVTVSCSHLACFPLQCEKLENQIRSMTVDSKRPAGTPAPPPPPPASARPPSARATTSPRPTDTPSGAGAPVAQSSPDSADGARGTGAGQSVPPGAVEEQQRRASRRASSGKGWSSLRSHVVVPPSAKPELRGWSSIMKMVVNKPTMGVSSRFTAPDKNPGAAGVGVCPCVCTGVMLSCCVSSGSASCRDDAKPWRRVRRAQWLQSHLDL